MHQNFVGADFQINNWRKIKDTLVEGLIRKCASQLRMIYIEINNHKPKVGNMLDIYKASLHHPDKDKDFTVELQRLVITMSLQPSFLERCSTITKNGVPIATILKDDKVCDHFPIVKDQTYMIGLFKNLKILTESLLGSIGYVQTLMCDITKIKHDGNVSSKIYDDLIIFIFGMKKEISSQIMRETFQEIVQNFKSKKISLAVYLEEILNYCLIFTLGEFWDYATCLYRSGNKNGINVVGLRADDKFRTYLQDFYTDLLRLVFPPILAEKNPDLLFGSFHIINDLIVLPVLPDNVDIQFGETTALTFETILLLLPLNCPNVRHLFKDELFCFFYSLFKLFVDQLMKDYKSHLSTFAGNIYSMVFEKFDKQAFLSTHPLKFPTSGDSAAYAAFSAANHRETYFRPIKVTKYLLQNCQKKLQPTDLQKLTYDCTSSSLTLLFASAKHLADSFDSSLFVVKNLLELYAFLEHDFMEEGTKVRLSQVSFSPRTAAFSEFVRGRVDLETLGGMLYELLPKMTEYSVDLKQNVCRALDHVLQSNLEVFGYLVSKPLAIFIDKVKLLTSKKENAEKLLKSLPETAPASEAKRQETVVKEVQEALNLLFKADAILQVYNSFDSTVEEIFAMMIDKLNVYADDNTVRVFREKFLPFLVDGTVDLLHTFYVEVAKRENGELLKLHNFKDASKWKEKYCFAKLMIIIKCFFLDFDQENINSLIEEKLRKPVSGAVPSPDDPKSPEN